jgi:hypothetical protein
MVRICECWWFGCGQELETEMDMDMAICGGSISDCGKLPADYAIMLVCFGISSLLTPSGVIL